MSFIQKYIFNWKLYSFKLKLYMFKFKIIFVQITNYICLNLKFWSLAVSWVSRAGRKADNHSPASQSDHSSTTLSLKYKYKHKFEK